MVGTDKPAFEDLASRAVDGVSIHFAVPEDVVAFTREVFVLCMDVESVGLELGSPQFAAKILTIHPKPELIGILGLVLHAVVDIVVRDAGARAERNLAAKVREEIYTVVVMVLGNRQFAMEHHPVYQVRQLA